LVAREIAEDLARRADLNQKIAKTVAYYGGLDVSACETAGLAHDLGHPPFGHSGEVELNALLRAKDVKDGFEGNAQSFRIVTKLDYRKLDSPSIGLDLTAVTLAAILKYPRGCPAESLVGGTKQEDAMEQPPKFGYFASDIETFEKVMERIEFEKGSPQVQSLEASIMDLADDITYAVHDLEDAYREGAIDFNQVQEDIQSAGTYLLETQLKHVTKEHLNPFVQLAAELHEKEANYFNKDVFTEKLSEARRIFEKAGVHFRFDGTLVKLTRVSAQLSTEIEKFFRDIQTKAPGPLGGGGAVYLGPDNWHLMQVLKRVVRHYVVGTSRVGIIERSQRAVVRSLFTSLSEWMSSSPKLAELPHPLVDYLRNAELSDRILPKKLTSEHYRAVADYICSMSDDECLMRSQWLRGVEVPEFAMSH